MMYRMLPVIKRLLCAALLLFTCLTLLPTRAALADDGPHFTPKQQAEADRLKNQYQQLRSDLTDLDDLFQKAADYRKTYVSFMYGEQANKHDTKILEQELAYVDNLIAQGLYFRKKGFEDLAYPNGFDSTGKNVVNINTVSNAIMKALPDYLTSRNYATIAIDEMHSGLNVYHQARNLDVPLVPKYHPPLYCLACRALER